MVTPSDSLNFQHDAEADGFDAFVLRASGDFPNNDRLPVILYREAVELDDDDPAQSLQDLFTAHGWVGTWRNGIFTYHHYHATAHEVLGIARGTVTVELGGDEGPLVELAPGDAVILPAGVAHRNVDSSPDLVVVGAYPPGQIWDMNAGEAADHPRVDVSIAAVPLPTSDPVFGDNGPLTQLWR